VERSEGREGRGVRERCEEGEEGSEGREGECTPNWALQQSMALPLNLSLL